LLNFRVCTSEVFRNRVIDGSGPQRKRPQIDPKIAILTYYHYPCHHPVLTNIFAKELAKIKKVVWLLQGDVARGRVKRWHNSVVLLKKASSVKALLQIFPISSPVPVFCSVCSNY
jgi:hypothetical protein